MDYKIEFIMFYRDYHKKSLEEVMSMDESEVKKLYKYCLDTKREITEMIEMQY